MTDSAVDHEIKSIVDGIIAPDLICDCRNEELAGLLKIPSSVDKHAMISWSRDSETP